MKHFVTILALAGALMLTSCNNFLDVKNVKKEIEDVIAYNNAKTINVLISCKEEMGSVLPSQTIQAKLGYDFDIQFIPNTQNYIIQDPTKIFEAVSWKDNSIRRDDCVEFKVLDQSVEDKQSGLYRVKAKVTKDFDDIQIQPKCALLPAIVSVSPTPDSTEYNANTTIIITVNTPLENEAGEGIKIPYGENGIKVKYGSIDMKDCFELPVLSSNHTKIIIQPKGDKLLPYLQNVPYVDITFSFSPDFKFALHGSDIYFAQNEKSSFTMKFNKTTEQNDPTLSSIFASRSELHAADVPSYNADDFFIIQALDAFDTADEIRQNRAAKSIYISGRAYDLESGISRIEVTEQRIKDNDARNTTDSPENPVIFTREDADFLADENGNTYFSLYFPFKSENGAIKITVTAYDGCGNHDSKLFIVFKKVFDEETIDPFFVENGHLINSNMNVNLSEDTIKEWLRKIHVRISNSLLGLYTLPPVSEHSENIITIPYSDKNILCSYKGTPLKFSFYTQNDSEWSYDTFNEGYFRLNTDKVSGSTFTISFSDDMGNSIQKEYSIVDSSDFDYLKNLIPDDEYQIQIFSQSNYKKNNYADYIVYDTVDSEGQPAKIIKGTPAAANGTFRVLPKIDKFFSDISDFVVNTQIHDKEDIIENASCTINQQLNKDNLAEIQVNVTIKEGKNFDYLLYDYHDGHVTQPSVYVSPNTLNFTILLVPELIIKQSQLINLFAVYNNEKSNVYDLTINPEGNDYPDLDTEPPTYDPGSRGNAFTHSEYDFVKVTVEDNSSGFKEGYIEIQKTGHVIPLDEGLNKIPAYEFDTGNNLLTIHLEDNNGNICHKTENYIFSEYGQERFSKIKYYPSSGPATGIKYWVLFSESASNSMDPSDDFGDFYELDSDGNWNLISYTGQSYKERSGYVQIQYPTISTTKNAFIKILNYNKWSTKDYMPVPFYFFANINKQNSGDYDYIQTKSATEFYIVSDAPTFVHTVVSQTTDSYEECKNWTAYEWLTYNRTYGERQYILPKPDPDENIPVTPTRYTITPEILNQIKTNECYCVIAHFADGSTYVSDVFKKE